MLATKNSTLSFKNSIFSSKMIIEENEKNQIGEVSTVLSFYLEAKSKLFKSYA